MPRIAAVSDLHGFFPHIPDCDLCLIAGDIVAAGDGYAERQSMVKFGFWLTDLVKRGITPIGIAGNHDFILRDHEEFARSLPWIYLCDENFHHAGLNFYGSPWQPWYGGWAFNAPEVDPGEEFLHSKFDRIPENTDVLIAHTPPAGILDRVGRQNVGSSALNKNIQRVMPRLVVCGHVHHCYGVEQIESVTVANAAHVAVKDRTYYPKNSPLLFDL